jgi:hypothetical protein
MNALKFLNSFKICNKIYIKHFFNFSTRFKVQSDICYYKLLNLNSNCSIEEIKKEYYKLAKKYHPDNNENSQKNQAVNKF